MRVAIEEESDEEKMWEEFPLKVIKSSKSKVSSVYKALFVMN